MLTLVNDGIFYTVQGEGGYTGVPSLFIRLSKCNLRCSWDNHDGTVTTCDTFYASHTPEENNVPIKEILERADRYSEGAHVVVTGGEPFLQSGVMKLISGLKEQGKFVTVETNGTLYLPNDADLISISPKLSSSEGRPNNKFRRHQAVHRKAPKSMVKFIDNNFVQFKFVVNTKDDIREVTDYIDNLRRLSKKPISNENIFLMPQGTSFHQLNDKLPWIIDAAKEKNWRVTDRLHVRAYGSKRGV